MAYTWSVNTINSRTATNIPVGVAPKPVGSVDIIDTVQVTCVSSAGNPRGFTTYIRLPDPVSIPAAVTPSATEDEILAAAKLALGIGGVDRCQQQADMAR